MITPIAWVEHQFHFDLPLGMFPGIVERLRGTPARAEELTTGLPEDLLSQRLEGKWSVKEHVGHLADLDALDQKRLGEFLRRVEALTPADMKNRVTEDARHNGVPIAAIIARLREDRQQLVRRLEALTEGEVGITAIHPRLKRPMRLMDWALFVAEHDDHHLAYVSQIISRSRL